ncbi:MAG: transposase [Thermoplasmata archaeon]
MAFIRYKTTKKGRKYAMEVESYWDKEKKQPRQRVVRYLGTVTEEGIKRRRPQAIPRMALDYGDVKVLENFAEHLKLKQILEATIGPENAQLVLGLAMNKLIRETSYSNYHRWYEGSYIQKMLPFENPSSQNISRVLERVGLDERAIWSFFERWNNTIGISNTMMYDISTFASYSEMISFVEYGRDYQDTGLKQVNLGLVCAPDSGLPSYFKLYPGSIADVVTLGQVVDDLKYFGVKKNLYVLDRGFFSAKNIVNLLKQGDEFIIPLPAGTIQHNAIIAKHRAKAELPEHGSMLNKKVIFHIEGMTEIDGVSVKYVHYYDPERKARELENLYRRISKVEEELEGKPLIGGKPREMLVSTAGDLASCFSVSIVDGRIHLKRKKNAIARRVNKLGKMILLYNGSMDWETVLTTYRSKDRIEKMFSELKTDLSAMPLRVHKESTLKGAIFVSFIALILYSHLLRRMKEANLSQHYSADGLLLELAKIKMIEMTASKSTLSEISKKCRIILERLGINFDSA